MFVLRQFLEARLIERGVAIWTVAEHEGITDKGLTIINKKGQRQTIEGDTIVFAADYKSDAELYNALEGKIPEIHLVGDSVNPCGIMEAIRDGARVGHTL